MLWAPWIHLGKQNFGHFRFASNKAWDTLDSLGSKPLSIFESLGEKSFGHLGPIWENSTLDKKILAILGSRPWLLPLQPSLAAAWPSSSSLPCGLPCGTSTLASTKPPESNGHVLLSFVIYSYPFLYPLPSFIILDHLCLSFQFHNPSFFLSFVLSFLPSFLPSFLLSFFLSFCSVLFCSVLFFSFLFFSFLFCSFLFCSFLFCSVLFLFLFFSCFCSFLVSVLFFSFLFFSFLFVSFFSFLPFFLSFCLSFFLPSHPFPSSLHPFLFFSLFKDLCIFMCMFVHVYIYVCKGIYLYACKCLHVYVFEFRCMYLYENVCVGRYVCVCM